MWLSVTFARRNKKYFSLLQLLHNKFCLCGDIVFKLKLLFPDIFRMIDDIDLKCGSTIFQEEVISKASALDPFNIQMQAPHLVFPHLEKLTCLYRRHERLYLRFITKPYFRKSSYDFGHKRSSKDLQRE